MKGQCFEPSEGAEAAAKTDQGAHMLQDTRHYRADILSLKYSGFQWEFMGMPGDGGRADRKAA